MAAAPASSIWRMLLIFFDSGDADGTMGFFRVRPMYFVVRSIMVFFLVYLRPVYFSNVIAAICSSCRQRASTSSWASLSSISARSSSRLANEL